METLLLLLRDNPAAIQGFIGGAVAYRGALSLRSQVPTKTDVDEAACMPVRELPRSQQSWSVLHTGQKQQRLSIPESW
jgi:hypothetical protein